MVSPCLASAVILLLNTHDDSHMLYTNYRGFVFHRYKVVLLLVDPRVRRPAVPDHGVRATARAPSRTPLSQSASALLNVKVCNCGNEVLQNGASADTRLPSSILQQLVHLSLMLHACREWLYRQVSLLGGCPAAQQRAFCVSAEPRHDGNDGRRWQLQRRRGRRPY